MNLIHNDQITRIYCHSELGLINSEAILNYTKYFPTAKQNSIQLVHHS